MGPGTHYRGFWSCWRYARGCRCLIHQDLLWGPWYLVKYFDADSSDNETTCEIVNTPSGLGINGRWYHSGEVRLLIRYSVTIEMDRVPHPRTACCFKGVGVGVGGRDLWYGGSDASRWASRIGRTCMRWWHDKVAPMRGLVTPPLPRARVHHS